MKLCPYQIYCPPPPFTDEIVIIAESYLILNKKMKEALLYAYVCVFMVTMFTIVIYLV